MQTKKRIEQTEMIGVDRIETTEVVELNNKVKLNYETEEEIQVQPRTIY
ncbi:unnamed protein product (macronuclear) [Paramecium tetraurelia]|uniref:Uncharacterized protein n=1 Tax=Paramecium tetraurelia TaxID=5888 RepID=A0D7D9_PARTE|nr:uncharacterized protein GSPATT00001998001 [Paramecium tetraurelia]CAK78956.1 unnamed protein product [Paramecium tetraurelia]|eukprot:XP_001446353.1 hypothetical protein (macronuclear) [Paramecium tetraurelia strain d4-2]